MSAFVSLSILSLLCPADFQQDSRCPAKGFSLLNWLLSPPFAFPRHLQHGTFIYCLSYFDSYFFLSLLFFRKYAVGALKFPPCGINKHILILIMLLFLLSGVDSFPDKFHSGNMLTGKKQRSDSDNSSKTLALYSCGKYWGGWIHDVPWRYGRMEKPAMHLLSPLNFSGSNITYPPSVLSCQQQLWTNLRPSWKINQHVIADANIRAAFLCSAVCFGALTGHRQDFLIVPTVCHMVQCYLGLQMASFVAFSL